MRSNEELLNALRSAPRPWIDTAIVVAFENRFEFVTEDHPDPLTRLDILQKQGGLAIGLAGMKTGDLTGPAFLAQVFREYAGQEWAHHYMDTLSRIVWHHSIS